MSAVWFRAPRPSGDGPAIFSSGWLFRSAGLGLPGFWLHVRRRLPGATAGRARSVIVILLSGGLGQHDSFDMKPEAPDGIRGEFKPIDTAVPGIRICEHLPRLAARAGKLAIIRSMSHPEGNHLLAVHRVLTGQVSNPRGANDLDRVASRDDFPCYAAVLDLLRRRQRWNSQRGCAAAAAGRRPSDLARPGRGIPGSPARSLAAPTRPRSPRGTR